MPIFQLAIYDVGFVQVGQCRSLTLCSAVTVLSFVLFCPSHACYFIKDHQLCTSLHIVSVVELSVLVRNYHNADICQYV